MRLFRLLRMRFLSLFARRQANAELDAEIQFHLERQIEENLTLGMTRDEARSSALRDFGGVTQVKEVCRDMRGINWIEHFRTDLRYTIRVLRKALGFSAAVILSLALGIGANTAIFSAINAVMLRTLPVERPRELVQVQHWFPKFRPSWGWGIFPYDAFQRFRDQNQVFSAVTAVSRRIAKARIGSDAEAGKGAYVSANFYSMLGVRITIGHTFTESDNAPAVVLHDRFWRRVFGGDPGVIGRTLLVDDQPYTICGVAAPGFDGIDAGEPLDFTVPIEFSGKSLLSRAQLGPDLALFQMIARLKPGISIGQASANSNVVYAPLLLERANRAANAELRRITLDEWIAVRPAGAGTARLRDDYSAALRILIAITTGVLLIGCVNVTNLLLARGAARHREFGVRLCLGAGRARIFSQMMTESLVLCAAGGIASIIVAQWIGAGITALMAGGRQTVEMRLPLDWRVMLFTSATTLLATVIVGLMPARRAIRVPPGIASRQASQPASGRLLRGGLVVSQVALSLVLVTGAGLFVTTLHNLETLDPGLRRDHVVLANVTPGKAGYNGTKADEFYTEMLDRIRESPGVRAAGSSLVTPISGSEMAAAVQVDGYTPRVALDSVTAMNEVSTGFFDAMGTPILEGRDFNSHDGDPKTARVLINQSFARRFFPGVDPLGRSIAWSRNRGEIIGVVRDAKYTELRHAVPPTFYTNLLASRSASAWVEIYANNDTNAIAALRSAVASINPNVPVTGATTFERQIQESLVSERLMATITALFGALALLMAAIGLYGVLAYSVAQRTREIGIRTALGAQRGRVIFMVIRQTAAMIGIGVAVGTAAALALGSFIASMLYDVKPRDPDTLAIAALLLFLVAAVAAYLPARRAARVDPLTALRYE
jgi:predicted permease